MKTAGIVLAGGLSRRFGSPKAFARFDSEYFYERSIEALEPFCEEVVVVTREELIEHFPQSINTITDMPEVAGLGPLAGIYSAMEAIDADAYAVLPCDMPYVDYSIMNRVRKFHQGGVTAVMAAGKHHPLVSVWNKETKESILDALLNERLSVMNLLQELDVTWINGDSLTQNEKRIFTNINMPNDLERS
ncbi:molybdenum cofactor guanylyltransferase [Sporosarcina sp. Marseille-Q4063]|uniref:molybdenum cofactor guanylyltransferase n=1 Tax=Sporosarcina sp. Marseille-Q4063 TaxID=2810514 RepID=UPI001BAE7AD1|nr:molybdenum cofactor guanylyltransferase [Sporosarcina sp. Marseille-Q4063]QUW21038.1 molybdenum cofactor guanylyltransferase [Sporosarcina sp. Marseille-Q4063]